MSINWEQLESVCVEGVDSTDYPKFCDAYYSEAYHRIEERLLTEDELVQLGEDYPENLNEMAFQSLV